MAKKTTKKISKNNSKTKKSVKKRKKKKTYTKFVIAVIIIAVIAYALYLNKGIFLKKTPGDISIIAKVNGEEITLNEVNEAYGRLPEEYKLLISKEDTLSEIVNERLLLQEAEKQGIAVAKEEAVKTIDEAIKQSELSEKEFKFQLDSLKVSRDYFDEYYRKQMIISRLLNETLFKKITLSDTEVEQFYEKNKESFENFTLGDSREEIRELLLSEKEKSAYLVYLEQLKSKADIELFLDKPIAKTKQVEALNEFKETTDSICKKDNKPIIRLYTVTKSKSCKWIKETFDSFAKEHMEKNEIIAYHWELNTGDNTLTEKIEKGIPKSELDVFRKYNPKSTVPTFVFGCKYVRIENAYENQNDLDAEKQEFENILEKLIT